MGLKIGECRSFPFFLFSFDFLGIILQAFGSPTGGQGRCHR